MFLARVRAAAVVVAAEVRERGLVGSVGGRVEANWIGSGNEMGAHKVPVDSHELFGVVVSE